MRSLILTWCAISVQCLKSISRSTEPEDANIAKSSVADIYALIDADLDFASANLPPDWPAKIHRQGHKRSSQYTESENTLLYRQNWGGALARAEEVITSNKYSLISPYYRLFKEEGENSTESIFEIQMYVNTNGSVNLGNNHNQVQGVRGSGDWDLGWGFNVPTESLINSYEPNDPRKDATILYSGSQTVALPRVAMAEHFLLHRRSHKRLLE